MANFTVRLVEGASNRTPWGLATTKGSPITVSSDDKDKLQYFQTNGRYSVEAQRSERTAEQRAISPSARPGRSGPAKVPVTKERELALAKAKLPINPNKNQLLALARDLGVRDIPDDVTNRKLLTMIENRQKEILTAELESSDDGDGEQDDDKPAQE